MRTTSMLVPALILASACFATSQGQVHAQCKVIWLLGIPCRDVYVALVNQIKAWKTRAGCETGGENCLYELVSSSPNWIRAKHTSLRTQEVQDLSYSLFPLEDSTVCRLTGDSVSESFGPTGNGTSYCSLFNLLQGSGLSHVDGYKQYTNEWLCLDYAMSNCSIY